MALGKNLGELRSMPASEFRKWKAFYYLEPFGWENDEYLTAFVVSAIANANRGKGKRAKSPKDFIRDTPKGVVEFFRKLLAKKAANSVKNMSDEEKERASDEMIANLEAVFGKIEEKK